MNSSTRGGVMSYFTTVLIAIATPIALIPLNVSADSNIFVQCPKDVGTELHPGPNNPGIKCIHLAAGDGMVTMADDQGKELYVFSFAELSDPPAGIEINTPEYAGWVMDTGLLAANAPAPTIVVDEGDELFLSLTNVGMAIRPDLFDPHTVHWHGFPQASAIFDGVPDASVSINMASTLTYYYKANDAGTYMYHCHVEAAEHMQMGMLGSLFVRPKQDRTAVGDPISRTLRDGTVLSYTHLSTDRYAFNDGDGTTRYDVAYPIQIGSFDPDFHDASFNVQPLPFGAMKDKYFMLNGRGYPDTVNTATLSTPDPLTGVPRPSQPVSSLITAAPGQRILLRISNLSVTAIYTLGTSGIKMEVVGLDARILRDGAVGNTDGNNMYYKTNSLTLGGGQSADVILTAPNVAGTYFLYTKNLDRLANNTENFGGMMTEIRIQ